MIERVIEVTDVFQARETVIPPEVIEQTIDNTEAKEERARKLPSSLVVCLVIAMSVAGFAVGLARITRLSGAQSTAYSATPPDFGMAIMQFEAY